METGTQTISAAQAIAIALGHHQAGRLSEAESIYRQVLAVEQDNAEALHLSGLVAHQTGNNAVAAELIGRAIRLQPANPIFLNNLGQVYRAINQPAEAERCLRAAADILPEYADAHANLGYLLQSLGRPADAEHSLRRAIELNAGVPGLHHTLGRVLLDLGRLAEAEQSCLQAIALNPDLVEPYVNLGNIALRLGHAERAERHLLRALDLRPEFAEAHLNLGNVYGHLGRREDAERCFRQAAALRPEFAEAHHNLGNLQLELGRLEDAQTSLRHAIALKPDVAASYVALGNALLGLERFADAAHCHRQAIALEPGNLQAHVSLGIDLHRLGRLDESEHVYGQALALSPGFSAAQFNLSILKLVRGDLTAGFRLYESRLANTETVGRSTRAMLALLAGTPQWQGEDLAGRSLLVWTEQGLGDSILAMRYLRLLKQRGAGRVIVCCEPGLVRLVEHTGGADEVVARSIPLHLHGFERHCSLFSLPKLFGTTLETIPADVPYVEVPVALKQAWAAKVGRRRALHVGLAWAVNRESPTYAHRSIPLARFAPVFAVPGVRFYSLQKSEDSRQIEAVGAPIVDWMGETRDFLDDAALIERLDLVISVDTSVAHLAGALGKPVWLLQRFDSHWTWMLEREDSPWYPSMRIFRQARRGDWDAVLHRVAAALKRVGKSGPKPRRRTAPRAPVGKTRA